MKYSTPYGPMNSVRFTLLLGCEQNWRCAYCGEYMTLVNRHNHGNNRPHDATIEHVIQVSDGGENDYYNCVAACLKCNSNRPNCLTAQQYFEIRPVLNRLRNKRRKRRNLKCRRLDMQRFYLYYLNIWAMNIFGQKLVEKKTKITVAI